MQAYVILIVYFLVLLGMGLYLRKDTGTAEGFYLAGRKLNYIVIAFTYFATYISAAALVGGTGMYYRLGPSVLWYSIASCLGVSVAWYFLAPKLHVISKKNSFLTIPDFFEHRFKSTKLRLIVSLACVFYMVPLMVSQYTAAGILFQNYLGVPYNIAVIVFGAIVLIYSTMGGYKAVAWTDTLQAIIMLIGLLVLIPTVLGNTGLPVNSYLEIAPEALTIFPMGNANQELLTFCLLSFFGAMGTPFYLIRFYTIKNVTGIKRGARMAIGFAVFTNLCLFVMGVGGRVLYPDIAPDTVAITMMQKLLPSFLSAMVLTAFAAAMMSSLDSVLMYITPTIEHDILRKSFNLKLPEARRMTIAKVITFIIGIISIIWGLYPPQLLAWLFWPAWGGMGLIVGSLTVLGLFWKKFNTAGALTLTLSGIIVFLGWYALGHPFGINAFIVALLVTFPLTFIVTMATQGKPQTADV